MQSVTSIVPTLTCQSGGLRYKASRDQVQILALTLQLCDLEEIISLF